jgi:hypothetical protein
MTVSLCAASLNLTSQKVATEMTDPREYPVLTLDTSERDVVRKFRSMGEPCDKPYLTLNAERMSSAMVTISRSR